MNYHPVNFIVDKKVSVSKYPVLRGEIVIRCAPIYQASELTELCWSPSLTDFQD